MDSFDSDDEHFMRRALELAREAEGLTAPNPMVGCVVVSAAGRIVGEGFHHAPGQAHAEVNALEAAGEQSIGGTLYVNLEPCCHFGRTPPCSDLVIERKLKRVVVAIADPNPKVAGAGIKQLQAAGIEVLTGVLASEASYLNRGFLKVQNEKLPWLALKMALTLDGRIADRGGGSRYVSAEPARRFVMALRNTYDCVLIGANTARLDDPQLDVRLEGTARNPLRAVIDTHCTVKPEARIFSTPGETLIFCREEELSKQKLFSNGRLVAVPETKGRLDLSAVLRHLLEQGAQKILCEGGGQLAGSLIEDGFVDELYWMVAAKMLLDSQALPVVASLQPRLIGKAVEWKITGANFLGDDLLITALNPRHDYLIY